MTMISLSNDICYKNKIVKTQYSTKLHSTVIKNKERQQQCTSSNNIDYLDNEKHG